MNTKSIKLIIFLFISLLVINISISSQQISSTNATLNISYSSSTSQTPISLNPLEQGDNITFYARYIDTSTGSPISTAVCDLFLNITYPGPYSLDYDALLSAYVGYYPHTIMPGDINYTINCSKDGSIYEDLSLTETFTVISATNPIINIGSPSKDVIYQTNIVDINYSTSDMSGIDSCWYSINNEDNITLDNCANSTKTLLAGTYNIIIYANDTLGNIGYNDSITNFTINASNDRLTIFSDYDSRIAENRSLISFYSNFTNISNNAIITGASCNITFNTSVPETYIMSYNGSYYNYSQVFAYAPGNYSYTINCSKSGFDRLSTSRSIILNATTYPRITITNPSSNSYYTSQNINLNFSVSDMSGVSNCWYSNNNIANVSISCINQTISFSDGSYNFTLYANDTLGNINSTTITNLTIDTTPPISPIIENLPSVVNTSTVNIIGYVNESNAKINITAYNSLTGAPQATVGQTTSSQSSTYYGDVTMFITAYSGASQLTLTDPSNIINLSNGRYIQIKSTNPTNFKRYNITSFTSGAGNHKTVNLSNPLDTDISANDVLSVYDKETYDGWFNITVTLHQGVNNTISVIATDMHTNLGIEKLIYVFQNTSSSVNLTYSNFSSNLSSSFTSLNISNLSNPYIGIMGIGQVNFSGSNISINGYNLDTNINISQNYVYLNSTAIPNLNRNATITFYNLTYSKTPVIYSINDSGSRTLCTSNCSVKSYANNILIFNVTHFSAYTSGINSQLSINNTGNKVINQVLTFTANYSNMSSNPINSSSTKCKINFTNDSNSYNMTFDLSNISTYSKSFPNAAKYYYTVNCSDDSYETLILTDEFTLARGITPTIWSLPSTVGNLVFNIIGYTNANETTFITIYEEGSPSRNISINDSVTNKRYNTTLKNTSTYINLSEGNSDYSIIAVPKADTSKFNIGDGVQFAGHNRSYYLYYNITNKTIHASPVYDLITITPGLNATPSANEVIYIYNETYPKGWFNQSFTLSDKGNSFTTDVSIYMMVNGSPSDLITSSVHYTNQLGIAQLPTIWTIENPTNQSSINVIGYVNESNVTVYVSVYKPRYQNGQIFSSAKTTNISVLLSNFTTIGQRYVNESYINLNVSDCDLINTGTYLGIVGYSLPYFNRYTIINKSLNADYCQLNITPNLLDNISQGTRINIYDTKYYDGWFNVSVNLFASLENIIEIRTKDNDGVEIRALKTIYVNQTQRINLTYYNFINNLSMEFENYNLTNLTNPFVGVASVGQVNFSGNNINLNGYDLDRNINFSSGFVFVNTTALANLSNTSATISLYNLNYSKTPVVYLVNDSGRFICPQSVCTIQSYILGTLIFNVTHFSTYIAGVNSALLISHINPYVNVSTRFTANYTNLTNNSSISGANCSITSQGQVFAMNESSGVYVFNYTFSSDVNTIYTINCSHPNFETQTATNILNVTLISYNAPTLWDINTYTTLSSINLIGYTNLTNINVTLFSLESTGNYPQKQNQTNVVSNVTIYGYSRIFALSSNSSIIKVPYTDRSLFNSSRYMYFSNHNRTYFYGYKINSTADVINDYTLVYLETPLESQVSINEQILVTNSSKPLGWFNITLSLFEGQNDISAYVEDVSGIRSQLSSVKQIFYQTQNPIIDISGISNMTGSNLTQITFRITDLTGVNLSTLLINVSNNLTNSYYATNSYNGNLSISNNINCVGQANDTNCTVNLVFLSSGNYNLTFFTKNIVGLNETKNIINYLVDLANPTMPSSLALGAFSTSNKYLNISWANSSALSGIDHYEIAIGNGIGNNSVYGWNVTNATNAYIGPLNLYSNNEYFISVKAVSNVNRSSQIIYDTILFYDSTGPYVENVTQSLRYTHDYNHLQVNWDAYEYESRITGFDVVVTKTETYPWLDESNVVYQFRINNGSTRSYNIDFSLNPLQQNVTYYVSVFGRNDMNLTSTVPGYALNATGGTTVDVTMPENISLKYGTGRIRDNNLLITINPGFDYVSGIHQYTIETSKLDYINGSCVGAASWAYFYSENISSPPNIDKTPTEKNISLAVETGKCYNFRLIVENNAGMYTTAYNTYGSASVIEENVSVDASPPSSFNVYDLIGSKDNLGLMTLNGESLTITWERPVDLESSILRYEIWVTEQAYNHSEQQFSPYNISSPLNLVPSNISEYAPGLLMYTLDGLNLNLSNFTDPTHQFKYRVYVRVWNQNNLSTERNSDGIIYIDNVGPSLSILWVENESQTTGPFYDYVQNNFTKVTLLGEKGMSCQWNPRDEQYKDISAFATNCSVDNNGVATCNINETSQGLYYYHISCKDKNGNINTALDNFDFNITLDFNSPNITITQPNLSIYSSNVVNINYTVNDYSINRSWIIINSTQGLINTTLVPSTISTQNYYYNYALNSLTSDYLNYTLTIFANDLFGRNSSRNLSFVYDNTIPLFDLTLLKSLYNESFNIILNGTYVRNITWNVSLTNNLSVLNLNGTLNNSNTSSYQSYSLQQLINFTTLDDGNYTITVWVVNDINRSSAISKTFVKDTTAPIINLPIFYMNDSNVKDIVLLMNQTQNIFGHNVSIGSISDTKDVKLNVDNISIYLNENNLSVHLKVGESIISNGKTVTLKNVAPDSNLTLIEVDGVIKSVSILTTVNGIKIRTDNTYPSDDKNNRSADITIQNYDRDSLDDNTLVKLLPSYYVYNGLNYYDSKIVLRVYNSSNYNHYYSFDDNLLRIDNLIYNSISNYNSNTNSVYYDSSVNKLFINQFSNISLYLGVEDLININSTTYEIYYKGDSNSTVVSEKTVNSVSYIGNKTQYYISEYLGNLQLTSDKNLTIRIKTKDNLGNQRIDYYNFTLLKDTNPQVSGFNISNNTLKSAQNIKTIYANSNFSINLTCNNSNNINFRIFNSSQDLVYNDIVSGKGLFNLTKDINYSFKDNGYYTITALCQNEINEYSSDYYILYYDISGPVTRILKPIVKSNSEYLLKEKSNGLFENMNFSISVENITSNSAMFKIGNSNYQNISIGANATFYSPDYTIRLLNTYYDAVNNYNSIASFRLTISPNSEKNYQATLNNMVINGSGDYFYKSGELNLYYMINDFVNENVTYNISLIKTSDDSVILNNTELNNSIKLGYIAPYTNVSGYYHNLTINLSNLGANKTLSPNEKYQIRIVSKDILNQIIVETFNFSMYNENPNFTYYTAPYIINMLNKEDNIHLLNAYDAENSKLVYRIESMSSDINATLINFNNDTYIKMNSLNESYVGASWIKINVTDPYNGFDNYNYTINISDSIGPVRFNINLTSESPLVLTYYYNTDSYPQPSARKIINYTLSNYTTLNTAMPLVVDSLNMSQQNISISVSNNYNVIFIPRINFSINNTFNITYEEFNKSLINQTSFYNGNQEIKDAFILRIDSDAYNGNYSILWNYSQFGISQYRAINFLKIFKLDINSTYGINYSSINTGLNPNISGSLISTQFQNFSLFTLSIESPTTEVCGDGIDQDQNGADLACSVTQSNNGVSGSSQSKTVSGVSGGFSSSLPKETCSDKLRNQNEIYPDCGGVCGGYWYNSACHITPLATCSDGARNQGEAGVDCGGPCLRQCVTEETPKQIESCSDGVKNQDESNIDCGGVCNGYWYTNSCHTTPQATCFDGIKNQDEEGIDCGAICADSCKAESNSFSLTFIMMALGGIVILGVAGLGFALSRRKSSGFDYKTPQELVTEPFENPGIQNDLITIDAKQSAKIYSHVDELIGYINKEQAKGVSNSKIKLELLNANWPKELVEEAFDKTECTLKLKELSEFIKKAKNAGHSDEVIRYHLIKAEWAEHFIDMVLHEVHVIHDDFEKVEKYAKNMLKKGYSKQDILKTLTDIGWSESEILPYIVADE